MKVPFWKQLPHHAQKELAKGGYNNKDWLFDKQTDDIRLTVLNLYVKLRGMTLWHFVHRRDSTSVGCLEFRTDVRLLKRELTRKWEFRSPEDSMAKWDSPEKRAKNSLHFKHFSGWPTNKVQAHIDQSGVWLGNSAFWWIGLPYTLPRHLAGYDSYLDVQGIRSILLEQGWDKKSLVGIQPRPR